MRIAIFIRIALPTLSLMAELAAFAPEIDDRAQTRVAARVLHAQNTSDPLPAIALVPPRRMD